MNLPDEQALYLSIDHEKVSCGVLYLPSLLKFLFVQIISTYEYQLDFFVKFHCFGCQMLWT